MTTFPLLSEMSSRFITQPIDNFSEVLLFDSVKVQKSIGRRKKLPIIKHKKEFLVCHDFKNGYHSDRFDYQVLNSPAEFYIPKAALEFLVTEFCYFSHHFITIPPKSWIDLCHTYFRVSRISQ